MQWLYLLARLSLGACLADDMGLGKTIQVLSLLLVLKTGPREEQASPARGTGFAACQLGRGDRPICAEPQGVSSPIPQQCRRTN